MKFLTRKINMFMGAIQIPVPLDILKSGALEKLQASLSAGKELQVQIDVPRKKRSLDANAALWGLLQEMACVLKTSKEELYIKMLERYGFFHWYAAVPESREQIERLYRIVHDRGHVVTADGVTLTRYQCYYGTSKYNSKEFSYFLDMIISEAQELGINFISEADKAIMLDEWGVKHDSREAS